MLKQFDHCQVSLNDRLINAMRSLEHSGVEIALVIDNGGGLAGILTDGDIRRALLKGAALDSPLTPYVQQNFTAVSPEVGRAEVLDLMQARRLDQIPVVDADGRLVGLHLLHELIGKVERPNWAVIMAGGEGTRLRPITEHLPKPMIPVAGRPILERLVLHLVGHGISRIFLSINYLGHLVEEHFGGGGKFGCRIEYLREAQPLGTGGPLSLLPEAPHDSLLVMNGDLLTRVDIASLLQHHTQRGNTITVAMDEYTHTVPFGCLEVYGDRISRLEEKPVMTRMINAGIYVMLPKVVGWVPRDQAFPVTALIDQAINLGEPVGAFRIAEDWIDVGQKDQLRQAREGI
jgi:dTDP-glucose pyrophosphorylase